MIIKCLILLEFLENEYFHQWLDALLLTTIEHKAFKIPLGPFKLKKTFKAQLCCSVLTHGWEGGLVLYKIAVDCANFTCFAQVKCNCSLQAALTCLNVLIKLQVRTDENSKYLDTPCVLDMKIL